MLRRFWEPWASRYQGNANAFSDFIEMGTNTRQTGLTIRLRGRSLPTVMFVSRRAWCRESGSPRSREASGSNPWSPTKSNLQILSHGSEVSLANAGERETLCRANRQSRPTQSGCAVNKEHCKSPGGTRTKATMANRVKGSTGSCNARWRREPGGGNTDQPEADHLRVSAEKAEREKLNDERGIKPLPVSRQQRRSRIGKNLTRMGRGAASVF